MGRTFVRCLAVCITIAALSTLAFGGTFTNTGTITIRDSFSSDPYKASPYPSSISVTGIADPIFSVSVTLNGFSHTAASDVDILLVGPAGQTLLMMSDVPGYDGPFDLTFTDSAAGSLPPNFGSGTYLPTNTNDGSSDTFPSPAPAGPYGAAFSVFNGTNANGTWNLYVVDDLNLDAGSISGGWTLDINEAVATPEPATIAFVCAGFAAVLAARRRIRA